MCDSKKANGRWTTDEKAHHINYLELLAAFFGLKHFAKHLRNKEVLLRIDNTTAISYINRMGSIQHPLLNNLARSIWQWCEERNLWIYKVLSQC